MTRPESTQHGARRPIEVMAPEEPGGACEGITRSWISRAKSNLAGDLVERVLLARGIGNPEAAEDFLKPSLRSMHDPLLIPDLEKAARRILTAVEGDESIVIFGDYDVDGVTASAILIHMIRAINPDAKVRSYIPHRVDEGYGLNSNAVRHLASEGARLIVSVDCGITALEPAKAARECGVDLIITDHHNPPSSMDDLPDAFAVVHPRRPDSSYPFGELCGAGVAYKVAWQVALLHCKSERVSPALRQVLLEMLGFAALGTIADIVPLVDENRVIVSHGLRQIPFSRIDGLNALIDASGLRSEKIDTESVGFRLGPRLNAIGRLGHAREALELMTDARGERAYELAEQLTRINEERKAQSLAILNQADEMAKELGMTGDDRRAIVLCHQDWHPGVVGIVCSKLVDRYARPVILMQEDGSVCKGSGRSIEGFNLHAALGACSEHLSSFGGHDMAAGMKCAAENFERFRGAFIEHANEQLAAEDLIHRTRYDTSAVLGELTPDAIKRLDMLAPFGAGNSRVRIRLKNLRLNGECETFGKTGSHLSLRVSDQSGGSAVRVIGWGWARYRDRIPPGAPVEMIVEPKISTWRNNTRVEPVLVDLRVC